jgi:hypothetical protein
MKANIYRIFLGLMVCTSVLLTGCSHNGGASNQAQSGPITAHPIVATQSNTDMMAKALNSPATSPQMKDVIRREMAQSHPGGSSAAAN